MAQTKAELIDAPLNDLSDVNTAGATNGQTLTYNGTSWVPVTPTTYTDEQAQDAAASLLTNGSHTGISFAYNDVANTIDATVTSSGFSGGTLTSGLTLAAGTATSSPVRFQSGSVLTTPAAGALEFDGNYLYGTIDTTTGRGNVPVIQTYRMTANGANTATTITDFFPANSSINLAAGQVYDFVYLAYLLKNTAGTLTWTLSASSAPTLITASYVGSPVTGIAAGTPIQGYTGSRAATTAAFAATASISNNAFMAFTIRGTIITNAATNLRLRVTNSAGNVQPQAGSYYEIREVSTNTGSFAA